MKWNVYSVTTKSGFKHRFVMGEWLMPGMYKFGEVELVARISDDEMEDYFIVEQAVYDMWEKEVLREVDI